MGGDPVWWTEQRKQQLLELFDKYSNSRIALMMGATSRNAVAGIAQRMGLKKTKPMPAEKKKRVRNRRKPMTEQEKAIRRMPKPIQEIIHGDDIPPLLDSIAGLRSDNCAYPYGVRDFKFCGRPREQGSFCGAHALLCYQPPKPRKIGMGRHR
jgi:hypothetical protein